MSASALNLSPTLHRLGPMREGFVWWRKICGFCTPLQRKISGSCLVTARLNNSIIWLDGLTWHVKDKSTT